MDIVESHKEEFNKVITFLKKDLSSIRTGRANTDLVAHILVEAYGTKTPLEQLAALSVPEPRSIVIQPWDKNIVKSIEIALSSGNLGTAPHVDDDGIIRLNLPALNEESRKNLVKVLHSKLENARTSLRSVRDKVRESIVKAERDKEVTQDDKYRLFEDLDKLSSEKQDEIKSIGERKEKEIMGT
ncbi:ribosome recycling factor [Patescibacteria group bacterium AH-259-L07]|nr:ribosome recycling factor [Patescibacteria group bacterium AH-259-L07]